MEEEEVDLPTGVLEEVQFTNVTYHFNTSDPREIINVVNKWSSSGLPFAFQIPVCLLYNLLLILAIFGNTLIIVVVLRANMAKNVMHLYICNLAISDLILAALCIPFGGILPMIMDETWPFGAILCRLISPGKAVSVFVSSYTLILMALDRYCVILLHPFKPRKRKRVQTLGCLLCIWFLALLTAVPIFIHTRLVNEENNGETNSYCQEDWDTESHRLTYSLLLMTLQFFLPLGVIIFTYSRIALFIWRAKKLAETFEEDESSSVAPKELLTRAKKKVIKMMVLVAVVYSVCWLPLNCLIVWGDLNEDIWGWRTVDYLYPILHIFATSHTVWNPLIYAGMDASFRNEFFYIISNIPLLRKLVGDRNIQSN